jgi:hypothetical protein
MPLLQINKLTIRTEKVEKKDSYLIALLFKHGDVKNFYGFIK